MRRPRRGLCCILGGGRGPSDAETSRDKEVSMRSGAGLALVAVCGCAAGVWGQEVRNPDLSGALKRVYLGGQPQGGQPGSPGGGGPDAVGPDVIVGELM